jgi:hypothetical protein
MLRTAVAAVALLMVNELNVIPAPKVAVVVPCSQCVNFPVRFTDRFCCPSRPELGLTEVRTGVPFRTVNPLARLATSVFVVTVTLRPPGAATASMLSTTVAVVAPVMVRDTTVIPVPKLVVVVPCTKCVFCPTMFTDKFCWPCWPLLGFTCVIIGLAITVKPLASDATSLPVVTVTVWLPRAAVAGMLMLTVRLVISATATLLTVMSEPKLT